MGSAEGGVEIEQVAVDDPEAIIRHHADPMLGLLDFQAREFAFAMGLGGHLKAAVAIAKGLVRTMVAYDADLVEINPLAMVRETGRDRCRRRTARLPRRQGDPRRLRAAAPSRPRGAARPRRGGSGRPRGARGGADLHQARRHDRLHGQRRRPGDDHDGPRQAGRRRAGQLPRHRRRRASRPGRHGDEDHPRRPEGRCHPRQHLRRHHPRRRGRPRADRGTRPADPRCADGRPDRRDERGRGRRPPRGGALRHGGVARRGGREGRGRSPGEPPREHPDRARRPASSSRASPGARASSTVGRCTSTAPGSSPA